MPVVKTRDRQQLEQGPSTPNRPEGGISPMSLDRPQTQTADFTTTPPPEDARDKTSPRDLQSERSTQAPVVPKSPTSMALAGGTANVSQPRGGGNFDAQNLARSFASRPVGGSMQGLMGGGLSVPGLEQTGSEAQASPLLQALMKMFAGR